MITKIWYSVQNGGDGSAYPHFMESEELTEIDQEHMDEGWGETCNGWLEIESDTPIKVKLRNAEELLAEAEECLLYAEGEEEEGDFVPLIKDLKAYIVKRDANK